MKLIRWDPFQELVTMSQLHRALDGPGHSRSESAFGAWAPPVDILEKDDNLVIRAELPGVQKEEIDVRVENGVLTLHGERKQESEVEEGTTHRMERVFGTFTRSFTLPTTVDASKVTATYKDGVLEVLVPKAETAKPKKIEIKAA
jgi:HSP20 family protein